MTAPAREGLLPCPFCGHDDPICYPVEEGSNIYRGGCDNTDCILFDDFPGNYTSREHFAQWWNTRATTPEPSSEVVGERLALEAIKAVTATCKDAAAGLSRIMAIARSAGVDAPYTDLMEDSRVRLIVERPRSEWRHLFEGACTIPPAGWYCTRTPGHDGPCAAHEAASRQPTPAPAADAEVRDGWKLVPVEPTEAMLDAAGGRTFDPSRWDDPTVDTAGIWSAMLAASPKAPAVALTSPGASTHSRLPRG